MTRIVLVFFSVVVLVLTSGCSVLGVATRGDLEAAMQREAAANSQLEARLDELDARLARARTEVGALEQRLQPRLAALDSTTVRTERRVARSTQQWRSLQALLAADLDSVRAGLDAVAGEVAAMSRGVAAVQEGMSAVSARASTAEARSREALLRQQRALARERDHLRARLQDLDARLASWPAIDDTLAADDPPATGAASADAAAPPEGRVEIRPAANAPQEDGPPPGR